MGADPTEVIARLGLRAVHILSSRAGRVVARAEDGSGERFAVKVDDVAGSLAGDVAAIEVLRPAGLPVPEVVAHRAGPPAVLVLRWIEGDPISSAAPPAAQRQAGRLFRAVHAMPAGSSFSGHPSVGRWIAAWSAEVATWWLSAGGTADQVDRFVGWYAEIEPLLADRTGTLTLFDGRAEHVLIRGDRVVGLIDLHDLGPGDPAMDLAVLTLTDEDLLPGVLDGYAAEPTEQEPLARLVPFYRMLRRLAGAEWHLRTGDHTTGRQLLEMAVTGLDRQPRTD